MNIWNLIFYFSYLLNFRRKSAVVLASYNSHKLTHIQLILSNLLNLSLNLLKFHWKILLARIWQCLTVFINRLLSLRLLLTFLLLITLKLVFIILQTYFEQVLYDAVIIFLKHLEKINFLIRELALFFLFFLLIYSSIKYLFWRYQRIFAVCVWNSLWVLCNIFWIIISLDLIKLIRNLTKLIIDRWYLIIETWGSFA
jgi:hypothetical protein